MPYQKPKTDHPWKQTFNQRNPTVLKEKEVLDIKPVKQLLEEILNNWDNVEVSTNMPGMGSRRYKLPELPQYKVALFISSLLKRSYPKQY